MRWLVVFVLMVGFLIVQAQSEQSIKLTDGVNMKYLTFETKETDTEPKNLIIALHWGWDRSKTVPKSHALNFYKEFIKESVVLENSIVIVPTCPFDGWDNEQAVHAINTMLNQLQKDHEIEKSAMVLTGYSAGGIGCWYYVNHQKSQVFKQVIPIAARQPDSLKSISDQPITIIHGELDRYFDIKQVVAFYEKLQATNPYAELISVPGGEHMSIKAYIPRLKNTLSSLENRYQ